MEGGTTLAILNPSSEVPDTRTTQSEFPRELRGLPPRALRLKSFAPRYRHEQQPLTAEFAENPRRVRGEIQIEPLPRPPLDKSVPSLLQLALVGRQC